MTILPVLYKRMISSFCFYKGKGELKLLAKKRGCRILLDLCRAPPIFSSYFVHFISQEFLVIHLHQVFPKRCVYHKTAMSFFCSTLLSFS